MGAVVGGWLFPDKSAFQRAFEAFHAVNPHVYRLFTHYAMEAHGLGTTRLGARLLWERMRWDVTVDTHYADPNEEYKLNDHYIAYYARHFMADHPELGEFFETRRLSA